ncbi:hypothetical protein [Aquifex sp.]
MRKIGAKRILLTVLSLVFLGGCAVKPHERGYTVSEYFQNTKINSEVTPEYLKSLEKYITEDDIELYNAIDSYYKYFRNKIHNLHLTRSLIAIVPYVGSVIYIGMGVKMTELAFKAMFMHPPFRMVLLEDRPVEPKVCELEIIPIRKDETVVLHSHVYNIVKAIPREIERDYRVKEGNRIKIKKPARNKLFFYFVKAKKPFYEFRGSGVLYYVGKYIAFMVLDVEGKISKAWKLVGFGMSYEDILLRKALYNKTNVPGKYIAQELAKVFHKACGIKLKDTKLARVIENELGNKIAIAAYEGWIEKLEKELEKQELAKRGYSEEEEEEVF